MTNKESTIRCVSYFQKLFNRNRDSKSPKPGAKSLKKKSVGALLFDFEVISAIDACDYFVSLEFVEGEKIT